MPQVLHRGSAGLVPVLLATLATAPWEPLTAQEWGFPPAPDYRVEPERPWGNARRPATGGRDARRDPTPPAPARPPARPKAYYDPWAPRVERPWGDPWNHSDPATPYRGPSEGRAPDRHRGAPARDRWPRHPARPEHPFDGISRPRYPPSTPPAPREPPAPRHDIWPRLGPLPLPPPQGW